MGTLTVNATNGQTVAAGASYTVSYPAGKSAADYLATGAKITTSDGSIYSATVSLGGSGITITNPTGRAIASGGFDYLDLDNAGIVARFNALGEGDVLLGPKNTEASLVSSEKNLLTGRIERATAGSRNLVIDLNLNKRIGGSCSFVDRGTPMFSWGTLSSSGHNNGGAVNADTQFGESHTGNIPYSASRARVDGTLSATQDLSLYQSFGIWINKSGADKSIVRVYVSGDGFATSAAWDVMVLPGTYFYVLPKNGAVLTGFTWAVQGTVINRIRVGDQTASVEAGAPYSGLLTGESYTVSSLILGPRSRATLLIQTDDGLASNVVNSATSMAGYPASGKTYLGIASHYGIRGTAYIIPELIGTATYMTSAQLAILLDAGWTLGSHSAVGAGAGLADLADTAAVYAEVTTEIERCRDLGIPASHARHFSLPQGGWSYKVAAALDMIPDIATVRGIGGANGASMAPQTVAIGRIAVNPGNKVFYDTANSIFIRGSQQLDGALTDADHDAYLAHLVAAGAVGTCYTHSISASVATRFDYFCNAAAVLRAAGKLDIMTIDEWYNTITADGDVLTF